MEYKVGDRVKHEKYGKGTVVEINSGATKDTVLVQFDNENESLHSGCECRGTYKNNTCWHFNNSYLEDIEKIDRYEGLELLNEIKKQERRGILLAHRARCAQDSPPCQTLLHHTLRDI